MKRATTMLCAAILTACGGGGGSAPPAAPEPVLPPLPAVELPAYEHVPGGPLVVLLALSAQESLYGGVMDGLPADLIGAGYSLLSLTLPCHEPGERTLSCWRERIEAGDRDLFLRFCAGLSNVLDSLGARDVSIVGQSRGGYVAMTCAAYDARIRRVALIAPVTDLNLLAEFAGYMVDEDTFGAWQYAPYLRSRSVLVRIGNNDERVGTASALSWADAAGADVQLVDVDGHRVPQDGSVTAWLTGELNGQ